MHRSSTKYMMNLPPFVTFLVSVRIYLFPTNCRSDCIYEYYKFSDTFRPIIISILKSTVSTREHLMLRHIVVNCSCKCYIINLNR